MPTRKKTHLILTGTNILYIFVIQHFEGVYTSSNILHYQKGFKVNPKESQSILIKSNMENKY